MSDVLGQFVELAENSPPNRIFEKLEHMAKDLIGVKLFTCSRFDVQAGHAERIYTNDAGAYPLLGLKKSVPNRWTEIVLDKKQTFVAETCDDLKDVFPDHEQIRALGVGATINLPVVLSGSVIGTVNMLDVDGSYCAGTLTKLAPLRIPAMIAFAAAALHKK